jgi:hypothetical protein
MVHARHPVKTAALKVELAENAAKLARLQTWSEGSAAWPQASADWVHSAGGGVCLRATTWRPRASACFFHPYHRAATPHLGVEMRDDWAAARPANRRQSRHLSQVGGR